MQDDVTFSGRFLLLFTDDDELRLEMLDQMAVQERGLRSRLWSPPTDVWESDDAYHVRVEVAGMRGSEITLTLHHDSLLIRGVRPEAVSSGAFQQMEIAYGEFTADVHLTKPVDPDRVRASYADGFLAVVLPKPVSRGIPVHEENE